MSRTREPSKWKQTYCFSLDAEDYQVVKDIQQEMNLNSASQVITLLLREKKSVRGALTPRTNVSSPVVAELSDNGISQV